MTCTGAPNSQSFTGPRACQWSKAKTCSPPRSWWSMNSLSGFFPELLTHTYTRSCIFPRAEGASHTETQQADGTLAGSVYRRLLAGSTGLVLILLHLLVPGLCPCPGELGFERPLSPLGRIVFSGPMFWASWASLDPFYTQPCQHECSSAPAEATPTSERSSKALHPGKGTPKISTQERDRREKASEAVNVATTLWWLGFEAGSL